MKHIVALSGGKDSTAMALRLREIEPETEFLFVCTPTGRELPEMFAHWKLLSCLLDSPIVPIMAQRGFQSRLEAYQTIPNHRIRWCTRELKIEPFKAFLFASAPAVAYVGLRSDEEERQGAVYGQVDGITQRYPLREWGWSINDVYDYLDGKGIVIPKRSDCDCCFFQTIAEWWLLWRLHPDRYAWAEAQETVTGHTWRSESRDSWPAPLAELRAEFETRKRKIPNLAKHLQGRLASTDRGEMCRACSM